MAKVLKVVAVVAGVVALAASAVATGGLSLGISASLLGTIGAVAGVVAAVASFGAQLLTKPPPARGTVNQTIVQTDAVQPYVMGRTYSGGVLRHTAGYGATLKKVPNPYLGRVVVFSGGGPIDAFEELQTDFAAIGAYYSGFLATDTQLGACPESTALVPPLSAPMTGWGSSHKLSGQAAALFNLKFDKEGRVFASGLPNLGAVLRGVLAYDPRLDSTFPGGSGAHRINNEATWAYSANPALHAVAYAYGRYQNGKKTFGIGLPIEAIDLAQFVAWANVCDANDWKISGTIYEPGDRWLNLKDIMACGGAEPVFSGAVLSVKFHAPRVSLDTITRDDLTDEGGSVTAMRSYRERINTIVPKWRSEDHNWEYVAGTQVQLSAGVTEDGEEKTEERQYNLVGGGDRKDQATQLATYELMERRELGTIELNVGPRLRNFRPGDCLTIDLPDEGLELQDAVILRRVVEPGSMTVHLTLLGETASKHAFALGQTGTAPPTPALGQSGEDRDEIIAAAVLTPSGFVEALISASYVTDSDPADGLIQATDTVITIETHTRTYSDKTVSVTGATITLEDDGVTALVASTTYHVYYDDAGRTGGAITYKASQNSQMAVNSPTNPTRHYLGSIITDVAAGAGTSSGGQIPSGWDYNYWYY